ncbi:hypothetical protein AVEN_64257-1 [Araneus ventricosus]|uniref:DUF5641 domain-containing protein n=1 Tax=Araneus ventricosus TaxID=182803 RepID=A0A4Y2SEQ3_ARAVE|nr:hypothetical protein AVEN_64257-1 [Araneus ventricosus]
MVLWISVFPFCFQLKHHLTTCLIRQCHLTNCHAGVQIIAAKLRERYWIIAEKRSIRSVVKNCMVCKRFAAKSLTAPPIHLPLDRIRESAVFEIIGIDLCGPLFIKPKAKAWIVLFTCAVYRAIHLEVVTSLSTEAFIQSLRRFNDLKQTGVPDLDLVDSSKLNIRLKHCDTVRKELRSRFRKEYLSQLVQKASVKGQSLKTGDVVLVGLDNRKRIDWPMGRVEKIYPSRDGFARVA